MNTSYLLYLAVLASLIHAFSIPAAIEVAQRKRGWPTGWFTWLKKAPWKEPGFSSLVLSLVYFGFIAGVTGVLMGTMQLNMMIHNTLFVVGHFHATVVSGTTLAFMGISYYLLPLLSQRKLVGVRIARWQPYVFSGGVAILTLAMLLAGRLGVPRRVADLDYADSPLGVTLYSTGPTPSVMVLVSFGALLAVIGGIMFVWVMVATLLKGERTDRPDEGLAFAFGRPERERVASLSAAGADVTLSDTPEGPPEKPITIKEHEANGLKGKWATFEAPGTYVVVLVFLGWFVAMYVIAHLGLARLWPVG